MNGLSKSEGDYVETIHCLIGEHGYARVADIASKLRVKPPSVTSMLQRLDERKFVNYNRIEVLYSPRRGRCLLRL